jgi:DNA-binding MarR family transcriptional regulator
MRRIMSAADATDVEAMVRDEPDGRKRHLRLWLRLLSCTNLISAEIRQRLRAEFEFTLPRFDLMAQLYREPAGLRLGELSKRMMVSNANVTALVDRLTAEGFVSREAVLEDRRALVVRLTKAGTTAFAQIAAAHEAWLISMFGELDIATIDRLMQELASLKRSVIKVTTAASDAGPED